MDYNYIESLVIKAKEGDEISKELLIKEFEAYISSLSINTFIYGYDIFDIKSECYKTLFKCLNLYNTENHRFVAYAINGIKQNLNYLIRHDISRSNFEGKKAFSLLDNDKDSLICNELTAEEALCEQSDYEFLAEIINTLTEEEKELISVIFYKGNTVKDYAKLKNMCYTTAIYRQDNTLKKLYSYLSKVSV